MLAEGFDVILATILVREKKMAAIKFEKSYVDPGGFWLSYQDPLHSERG
jgi:hypothetical protein